ncbi:MAG: hypothetical protein WD557_08855 [Dehalococcoidia bacterium]
MARDVAYKQTDDRSEEQSGLFTTEHSLAWVMALASLALGAIGLLAGFGMIGSDDEAGAAAEVGGAAQAIGAGLANWQEGLLWIIPAISAGLLAYALHNTGHHRARSARRNHEGEESESGVFNTEHSLAYLMVLLAIGSGALGLLVGFDVFENNNTFADGMLWAVASLVPATLAVALHEVRHHQMASEEDVIVRLIEERTGPRTTTTAPRTERVSERPGERSL